MKLLVSKIKEDTLSEKELSIYNNLDQLYYGQDIASKVTYKLVNDRGLFHSHKYYCGMGLFFYENSYTMGDVHDGYEAPFECIVSCNDEQDFISWLANENDQSMSSYGEKFNNQTITKIRLEWFLEEDYSPVWNDYCMYIRRRNLI